jgi:single-stranded-DNA-specific exonuclease
MAAWELLPQHPANARVLAEACALPPLLGQLLLNRGLTTPAAARRFLAPSVEALESPTQLPNMSAAVRRLKRAIAAREHILVFSDSDVDGLTAAAIVSEVLVTQKARVTVRISNRIDDGYGFPAGFISRIVRAKIGLVMLLDCGTNQPDEVHTLRRAGIDTIILDHHVPARVAEPEALVNPYLGNGHGRELCSAGLALKLAQAWHPEELPRYLDVAAVGTLADYAPLVGENRMFIRAGLTRLSATPRPGLRRLCEAVRVTHASPEQVLRLLVPRLNAAGRLGDARAVWKLLVASTTQTVERWVEHVGTAHAHTKQLYREMLSDANEQASRLHCRDHYVMVVGRRGWHPGLVGPIAAQLTQRYQRPAIAIALDHQVGIGSGRSSVPFNLFEALQACEAMLMRFGGHPRACGLTLASNQVEAFRSSINQHAHRLGDGRGVVRPVSIDVEASLEALTPQVGDALDTLKPFGPGNPRPTVLVRGVRIAPEDKDAWLTDGRHRVRLRGRWDAYSPRERYDVIATLQELRGEPAVSLVEVRLSSAGEPASAVGAPWSPGLVSGRPCTPADV